MNKAIKFAGKYAWGILAALAGVVFAVFFASKWWDERKHRKRSSATAEEIANEHAELVERTGRESIKRTDSEALDDVKDEARDVENEVNNDDASLVDWIRDRQSGR